MPQYESTDDRFDGTATCRCVECDLEFTVAADTSNGDIDVVAAAEHGGDYHQNEAWNYEIIERPNP